MVDETAPVIMDTKWLHININVLLIYTPPHVQ